MKKPESGVGARARLASLVVLLCVSGCASYSPHPLDARPAVLAGPGDKVLEARAASIERPWLPPREVNLSAPLTGDAIAALAVVNNPDLASQRARAGVADAQAFAAGLLPDPSFSFGADKVLSGPDTFLNVAGALGIDLNALRTRAVTREQALQQAKQVRLDLAWSEWQTAGAARLEAVRIVWLGRIVGILRKTDDAARLVLDRTSKAATRGDVPASQAESARVAAFDAGQRLRTAEQALLMARHKLNALLGLPPETRLALAAIETPPPPPDAAPLFVRAQKDRLDLAALRAGYASQEASVHKAVLDQFPSLALTLNVNRDSANNMLVGPAVDFTLPLWNWNRGGIAVARATRDALKAEYDARQFKARADIAETVAAMRLARRQLETAQGGLAGLEQQAAAAQRASARGDLSMAAALTLAQQSRDRQEQIAQIEQSLNEQEIALELLVGAPRQAWGQ